MLNETDKALVMKDTTTTTTMSTTPSSSSPPNSNHPQNDAADAAADESKIAALAVEQASAPRKTVDQTYKKLTGVQHILHRPELYVGVIEHTTEEWWVPHQDNPERMVRKRLHFSPALFKIFDEILVNAADNKMRVKDKQTRIDVEVVKRKKTKKGGTLWSSGENNVGDGLDDDGDGDDDGNGGRSSSRGKGSDSEYVISIYNDGGGIPIQKHRKHNMYVPEMIFGHLLTSSNYDDGEAKVTGGRHGYGAKLTNIFSTHFMVETACGSQFYSRAWHKNMSKLRGSAVIKAAKKGEPEFTRITFAPDLRRFHMPHGLDHDIERLFQRRALDVAATTGCAVTWTGNGLKNHRTQFNSFLDFALRFLPKSKVRVLSTTNDEGEKSFSKMKEEIGKLTGTIAVEKESPTVLVFHQRMRYWDVVVAFHLDGGIDRLDNISFVNNVATHVGGSHLKHVQDILTEHLVQSGKAQHRKDVGRLLKSMMQVFVNATVHNPTFGSQLKDRLLTPMSDFYIRFRLHQRTKAAFDAARLVPRIVAFAERELGMGIARKAMRQVAIRGRVNLPKLDDANWAGSDRSDECTLILTEGDSAKALAVSGLAVVGRDKFGVFPLKGKLLNARQATLPRVAENDELANIMKAMGLRFDEKYPVGVKPHLRYGRIMIMADQDYDGSHIKGLLINFIHVFWPSLLAVPGFITQFITPIVKALPANKADEKTPTVNFFSIADFHEWKKRRTAAEARKYTFKYYKGLGTSTATEGREYFSAIAKHSIAMVPSGSGKDSTDAGALKLAFAGDMIEGRKFWVSNFSLLQHDGVDFKKKKITFYDFIHKELILYSVADCERNIPSVIDGFKPSQRKILFAAFKRNLTTSVKVEQFAGYVSEHAAYHHGEVSLHNAIVNLAQDYVGSNNLALLVPDGQFGTRHEGGHDHASARYIFTHLHPLARKMFPAVDDALLTFRDDDGQPVEPYYYVPIIPMVLVNGAHGIGTGFATSIPQYNPLDVIKNVRRLLLFEQTDPMIPWHEGFTGAYEIAQDPHTEEEYYYNNHVVYFSGAESITVSDVAPGVATSLIKKWLVAQTTAGIVREFSENHTPSSVHFSIQLEAQISENDHSDFMEELCSKHCRRGALRTHNMYGFDRHGTMRLWQNTDEILEEHFAVRMDLYNKRYEHTTRILESQLAVEKSKLAFVDAVLKNTIKLETMRSDKSMLEYFRACGFAKQFPGSATAAAAAASAKTDAAADSSSADSSSLSSSSSSSSSKKKKSAPSSHELEKSSGLTGFEYLLRIPISSFNSENRARAAKRVAKTKGDIALHKSKTPAQLYLDDLDDLEAALTSHYAAREAQRKKEAALAGKHMRKSEETRMLQRQSSWEYEDEDAKRAAKEAEAAAKERGGSITSGGGGGGVLPGGAKKRLALTASSSSSSPSRHHMTLPMWAMPAVAAVPQPALWWPPRLPTLPMPHHLTTAATVMRQQQQRFSTLGASFLAKSMQRALPRIFF